MMTTAAECPSNTPNGASATGAAGATAGAGECRTAGKSDRPQQRTVAKSASVTGVGLHTGDQTTITLHPAPVGAGITFVRTDLPHRPTIPATPCNTMADGLAVRRTTLAREGVQVQTVEHLLAAMWAEGIDNALVEITGQEVPGLDGSAKPFVDLIRSAGATDQGAARKQFALREPIAVEEGSSSVIVFPSHTFRVSYTLSYPHPALGTQFVSFCPDQHQFEDFIAPARTFCLKDEVEILRAKGFGRGANQQNTLVIGANGVEGTDLRFADEAVRHKILDLLGDLYLLGARLKAHVVAIKSGHSLNAKLVHKLSQAMEQWKTGSLQAGTKEVMVGPQLDITQIERILPHRYPFLLVDRVIELTDTMAVGIKNVTMNDYFFQGHFPGRPVMPGVLMVEALAQVGGILILNKAEQKGKLAYFMSVDNVKFRKPVVPGDQLALEVTLGKIRSKVGSVIGRALVDGKVVCEGELTFALVDE